MNLFGNNSETNAGQNMASHVEIRILIRAEMPKKLKTNLFKNRENH